RVSPVRVALRREREVARVPARREGDAGPPVREVIDDRPLLRDADRVMEREDDAPRADADARRRGGERRAGDGRVRVEAAEGVEVPLRRPDRAEAVRVGEASALEEEAVARSALSLGLRGEVEEAEVERARGR